MNRLLITALELYITMQLLALCFSLTRVMFTRDGKRFLREFQMLLIWPLAIMTKPGRQILFDIFNLFKE